MLNGTEVQAMSELHVIVASDASGEVVAANNYERSVSRSDAEAAVSRCRDDDDWDRNPAET